MPEQGRRARPERGGRPSRSRGRSAPPRAIWKVFAADSGHHGLIVSVLGRFKTSDASQMLAALAVYSRDDKARAAAVAALRGAVWPSTARNSSS